MEGVTEIITTDGYIKNVVSRTEETVCMHTEYVATSCVTCVKLFDLREFLTALNITAEDCQKAFGMGEHAQEQRDTTMDGVELETMDAKDAEALRRCTLDE